MMPYKAQNYRKNGYKLPAWPFLLVVLLVVVATGMWLKDWENKGKVSYAEYIIPSGELRREFQELKIKEENAKLKQSSEELQQRYSDLKSIKTTPENAYLENEILPLTRKYGIPDCLAAAQWALESGRAMSKSNNNHWGLGPGMSFRTMDDAARLYAKSLRTIVAKKGADFDQLKNDPYQILVKLQEGNYRYEAHNPDPKTYINSVSSMKEWRAYQ